MIPTTTTRTGPRSTTRKLVPAVGLLAVVALSAGTGSAVAAKMITGADIKNNSVTGKDIKDGSLATKDLDQSTKGKLNKAALPGYEINSETIEVASSTNNSAYANCSAGKVALGGGAEWEFYDSQASVVDSQPALKIGTEFHGGPTDHRADAWRVTVRNASALDRNLTVYVICANPN